MTRKAYWNRPPSDGSSGIRFPSPISPPVPNGDGDANPFVDPYGPLVV